MSLSVPYHPYQCCLICGKSHATEEVRKRALEKDKHGQEWIVEWWPKEAPRSEQETKRHHRPKLLRCSLCKQALYCSQNCQRHDWNVSTAERSEALLFFIPCITLDSLVQATIPMFRFTEESATYFKTRTG